MGFLIPWLSQLNVELQRGSVLFKHEGGHRSFHLKCDDFAATKNVILKAYIHTNFGTFVFHHG